MNYLSFLKIAQYRNFLRVVIVSIVAFCFGVSLQAQAQTTTTPPSYTYINGDFVVYAGAGIVWATDIVIGPNAHIYIEDGASLPFYGQNLKVDPAAKFSGFLGSVENAPGVGTGKIVFMSGNPADPTITQQTLDGGASASNTFPMLNIEVNNPNGLLLVGDTKVSNDVTLTQGHITLGTSNLMLGENGKIVGADITKHIITNSTGSLLTEGIAQGATVEYPIGISASEYTPVHIKNNAPDKRTFYVQVQDAATSLANTKALLNRAITRVWQITSDIEGPADITLDNDPLQNQAEFDRTKGIVSQQITANWWTVECTVTDTNTGKNMQITSDQTSVKRFFTKHSLCSGGLAELEIVKTTPLPEAPNNFQYDYILTVTNTGEQTATDVVAVDTLPEGLQFIGTAATIVDYDATNGPSGTVTWNAGTLEPKAKKELSIKVKYVAKDLAYGGTRKLTNTATVAATEIELDRTNNTSSVDKTIIFFVADKNVFTPNGDGVNDRFFIMDLTDYPENVFEVFDSLGSQVYFKEHYNNEWDGHNLRDGTYFYFLKYKDKKGKWLRKTAWVTVIAASNK